MTRKRFRGWGSGYAFNKFAHLPPSQKWIARAREAGVPNTRDAIDAFRRAQQR